VPAWGLTVLLRKWSVPDYIAIETHYEEAEGQDPETRRLLVPFVVCRSLADPQGNRIFTDDDIEALAAKDADSLISIARAAFEFNRVADAVEDGKKKSEHAQSSPSPSP
jgi:hypothetical protein